MKKQLCWSIVCLLPLTAWGANDRIEIARFSQGGLSGWQSKVFSGETTYTLRETDDQTALFAQSQSTASGLFREVNVDLNKTPILNWSWKIDHILTGNDERSKSGDDYPARIYVVFSGGMMFWRTRAINYVWSNHQPVDSSWRNAFTGNAGMIAVQSGTDHAGRWMKQSRDVRADYRLLFGEEPGRVDAVAIMTDTDNTGVAVTAWYGDIWFSAK
jgi:Protein of unknown function (DUF3047)